jgi:hypothetical protein
MKRLILLIAFALLPSLASAATFFADPAGGGAASCVDSGANVCTLTRALTVAATGDTITAACGTYSQAGTTVTVSKNVTIAPVTALCATITGTNATSIVTLTPSNDANILTFQNFIVQNTGGATSSTMIVSNVAYDATVVMNGNTISVGGTNRHLAIQATRGTTKITNNTFTGTVGTQAAIYSSVTPSSAMKVSITGNTCTVTLATTATYCIFVERAAGSSTSEWVYVANNVLTETVSTDIQGIGIRLNRITSGTDLNGVAGMPPVIENNTVTITTSGTQTFEVLGIAVSSTDATAVADNAVIRNNTVTCISGATRCIVIGVDGTTANFAANVQIVGNTVFNTFYNATATPHGISAGRATSAYVAGNIVKGFAAGILASQGTTHVITGNLVVGAQYAPLFAKGNTSATFANNTVIMDDTLYGAVFGGFKACMSVSVQGAVNNAATTFQNNNCYVRNGSGWSYALVANTQVANFDHNNYWSLPTLTTPWSYQSTTYATLTLWNAAATVGTDTLADPIFVDPANDYRLAAASTLRETGLYWGASCLDVRGRRCSVPPNVGAYQNGSGDPAVARTTRQ